jgi:hypothetical protein
MIRGRGLSNPAKARPKNYNRKKNGNRDNNKNNTPLETIHE